MKEKIEFVIAQFNAVVGDIEGNTNRILKIIDDNRSLDAIKVFIFPELALCGYMPEDLLFREDFANKTKMAISGLKEHISSNEYLILGAPKYSKVVSDIRNSVFILNNREIKDIYDKQTLPNYGVFDEKR
jgi:NAD+ synthase (glutamine-hydrolysing)